ncbi:metal-dependent hydrolase [Brevibacillus sp. B_LB10_24]|uniref:metal-dependent hydrolase n=1 Tax=Brevibacillus sp. B_LB10_24 TaxID=3380645 RepID=UPI0038BA5BF1
MKITYHGHSCVQITHQETSLIIDPFLSPNPQAKAKPEDIQVQYVLLTHGHADHIADAAEIAKRNNATVIATFELANYMSWQGASTFALNLGGSYTFDFGRVEMTQAFHSSGVVLDDQKNIIYMGMPGGFVLTLGDKTLYHAGDTGLFGDMKLIGEKHSIDLAFLPIGDTFTMGPGDALKAAEWVRAKAVIPIHYNTFPVIEQNPQQFVSDLEAKGIKGAALAPGDTYEL